MSDELEALTNEIMADLLDRNGILDGVGDDMLAEITATVAGVVGQARAAGATAEKARWEAAVEAERSEWVAYARAGGLPRHDEAGAALTALDELLKLLEKVNEA